MNATQTPDSSTKVIVVSVDQTPDRIDHYLSKQVERLTRSRIQKLIKDGKVTVDQEVVKPSYKIKPGQTIIITFPPPPTYELIPQEINLNIIYEDESLLVINKQAGLVMHPAYANVSGTLVNALLFHSQSLSTLSGIYRPGIVHRLDKDTSGLLVIAKNDFVHAKLAEQFSQRTILREYRALVWGHFKQKTGRIETLINRSLRDRTRMTISATTGKPAITNYEVLEEYPLISLLRVRLETGRTHQIRVHLASKGHPVLGDPTYGGRGKQVPKFNQQDQKIALQLLRMMPRQALHAKTLGFVHPETGQQLLFDSDLPEDIQQVINFLEKLKASRQNTSYKG
ncbi:MAG: RluA family pseudouridine synthase [candidate division KSB1 bacterium]|nr:RluA family pseudouridine synthase [candidate division KSB1 bacterium]MDZ7334056.1 RluA family pseudouridine synthase [candidate division KSB1 bacterium]MDZ7356872.1 RluA family pseudouridine synthase [candidate division KSB1 bacterium]MDZ7399544.1 RluA family pseudouridine synthase [candidate division KSB1 bacterium]